MTPRPDNPLTFRREICGRTLQHLMRGDSLTLIGVGSSGKSNVARHLARRDVREFHLGDAARNTAGVLVDFLNYAGEDVIGLHSLLVESLVKTAQRPDAPSALAGCLNDLRMLRNQTATATTPNASRMFVSDTLNVIFSAGMQRVFFLLDDFDQALQNAPPAALRSLRAFRDDYKGRLAYVAVMRKEMAFVRPDIQAYEDFYELVSKPVLAVGAYDQADAEWMMDVLAAGNPSLAPALRWRVLQLSGGHPGLIKHIFRAAETRKIDLDSVNAEQQLADRADVIVECDRIWDSMDEQEHEAATAIAMCKPASTVITARLKFKTLAKDQGLQTVLFSPVFERYVLAKTASPASASSNTAHASANGASRSATARFDLNEHVVVLDGRRIGPLDDIEFHLLERLWQRRNNAVPGRELLEIVVTRVGVPRKHGGSPESRRDAYLQDIVDRVNLPNRRYIQANSDGSYAFIEAV